jgi:hypothetical protein
MSIKILTKSIMIREDRIPVYLYLGTQTLLHAKNLSSLRIGKPIPATRGTLNASAPLNGTISQRESDNHHLIITMDDMIS